MTNTTRTDHASARQRRAATVNLRLSEPIKNLIDAAAAAVGKTRTEFMVESARQRAVDALLDRRLFELDPARWAAFTHALDAPPRASSALKKLLTQKPPWAD